MNIYLRSLPLAAAVFGLVACSDHDLETSPLYRDRTFQYSLRVEPFEGSTTLLLDSLNTDVKGITGVPEWCTVKQDGIDENGHPVLRLTYESLHANTERPQANVHLTFDYGNEVNLTISQQVLAADDRNGSDIIDEKNKPLLADWRNANFMYYMYNGGSEDGLAAVLPWSNGTTSNIRQSVVDELVSDPDWRLVLCHSYLYNRNATPMLAFYHPYTGKLRMLHYIDNMQSSSASEYFVRVGLGYVTNGRCHQPYGNAFRFAIPTSRTAGAKLKTTFSNAVAGYPAGASVTGTNNLFYTSTVSLPESGNTVLRGGWMSYDVDMSGYNNDPEGFFRSSNLIPVNAEFNTTATQNLLLNAVMDGNIKGEFDNPYDVTTLTGAGYACQWLDKFASYAGSISDVVESAGKFYAEPGVQSALGVLGAGASLLSSIISDTEETSTSEHFPGTINLGFNGTMQATGKITGVTTPNVTVEGITVGDYLLTDGQGLPTHFGEGVISLQTDPLIYIVKDAVMAHPDAKNYRIMAASGNHNTVNSRAEEMELRQIQFMWPDSIKVNINQRLFKDKEGNSTIRNVGVDAYYGLLTDATDGYTAPWREVYGMTCRDREGRALKLVDSDERAKKFDQLKIKKVYVTPDEVNALDQDNSYWKANGMTYGKLSKGVTLKTVDEEDKKNTEVTQRFEGLMQKTTPRDPLATNFMVSPTCYFPTSGKGRFVNNMDAPDYVVCVEIGFDADVTYTDPATQQSKSETRHFAYRRFYLPEIEYITAKEAADKITVLETFANKCINNRTINYTNGGQSVTFPNGALIMNKDIQVLKLMKSKLNIN